MLLAVWTTSGRPIAPTPPGFGELPSAAAIAPPPTSVSLRPEIVP